MMLCKLSLKNIKKSFKDYAIYFFTLILGVAIFYVFNAIDSQTVMMKMTSSTREIIKLMTNMLSGVSVFVSFILGFLIVYASRFLIKRRKSEFGVYLTLGMSKYKISRLLFFETVFIGIISLVVGLGLGFLLSQLMSLLVANMFEADLTSFTFVLSKAAILKTILYFGIMYLLVMIFNTISISRCKLIDLLYAARKSEKIRLKNPVLCFVIFLISCGMLGYAYYLVTGGVEYLQNFDKIFIPISLGVISTFFIFWSLSGLLVRFVMRCKKIYYKGLNSFTLRQVSSKINTTVFSMTIICLMLFITICVLSSALSIKNSMTANLKKLAPVDIEISKKLDLTKQDIENDSWLYNEKMMGDSKLLLRDTFMHMNFDFQTSFKDIVEFIAYGSSDILVKDTLGSYFDEVSLKYPYLRYEMEEMFVRVSDYNKVARLYGLDEYTLGDHEYILVANYDGWLPIRNEGLKRNTKITLLGEEYYPKYEECQDGFIEISANPENVGFFVVPDDAVHGLHRKYNFMLANYRAFSDEEKEQVEALVKKLENSSYESTLHVTTKLLLYESSVGLGAMVTFIGLYLGVIFLISSAAILALKELSESSDNKERFMMLRRIGADDKMIHKALFRQIAIFFLFPLVLAIIHSIFGIWFCDYILETFGNQKLLISILMTAIFLVVIYGGYFIITYLCSKSIIKERI